MAPVQARFAMILWMFMASLVCLGEPSSLASDVEDNSTGNSASRESSPSVSPDVTAVMEHLEPLWESMRSDIVSTDAKLQVYYQIQPHQPLTQAQIHEKLKQYPFAERPEEVTAFLQDVAGPDATRIAPVQHLLEQGGRMRHDAGPVIYVHLSDLSLTVTPSNKQIYVYDPGRTPTTPESLSIFRSPMKSRAEGHLPTRIKREGQVVHLESNIPSSPQRGAVTIRSTIDWATGVPLMRSHSIDSKLQQETIYSGLTTFSGGVTLPRFSTIIRYEQDRISTIDLAILLDAAFNEPLSEQVFQQGKPEKWKVFDYRGDLPGQEIRTQSEAVADVRTVIPDAIHQTQSVSTTQLRPTATMSIPMRAVLILNGTALITLGVWMWRHASFGGQKP